MEVSGIFILPDDESIRKKLTVMSKWDCMMDDGRNEQAGATWEDEINQALQVGKTYRVTIKVEEVPEGS